MKKILLAFDGAHFSEGAFEFARRLNEIQRVLITGIFIPQVDFANLWSYANSSVGGFFIPLVEDEETEKVKQNIEHFESLCRKNKIEYRVHKDFYDFAIPELKRESRFADILILGSESFYSNIGTNEPNEYFKDALEVAECPVLIVPEKFDFPQNTILAYDGSASSVFAIKQFSYLFPGLCDNPTQLVAVQDEEENLPDEQNIEELASRHFSDLSIQKLDVEPRKYFSTWFNERKATMLVSGSFGRSFFSQLFKKSFVSDVIKEHKLPVFLAHH